MKLVISPRAEKNLKKLSKIDQIAVAKKTRGFSSLPILNEEKLSGYKNIFRARVGNIKIVYRRSFQEIFIVLIAHRKEIYKLLKQLF